MAIFSKILSSFSYPKMFIIGEIFPPVGTLTIIGTVVLCFLSFYLFKWIGGETTVRIRDYVKNHSWTPVVVTSRSWYCSICESLLLNGIGVYCDCCGVCADSECIKKANVRLQCKIVTSNNETQLHHWIKGNLPFGATCYICNEDCSMEPGLVDYQCCWCQRSVHTNCNNQHDEECDFGRFRNHIVPPWSVQVARRKGAIQKHLLLRGVRDPGWKAWKPLIVIANKKAGNNDGATVLSEFRKYLNPVQVIDLSERKPAAALQWCVLMAPKQLRILVAGGDGTINWVLTTSHKLDLDPEPLLSIIPLGTGNDLSRVLGWGSESASDLDVDKLLKYIEAATPSKLDRWKIEAMSHRHLGLRIPSNTFYMYNYFSVGVDAQVCLNFHRTRDSVYYFFGNRICNKLLYLCFGTQQVVTSDCKNLEKRLDLYIDGKLVELPELESIVVLNIPSWGAGVNLWNLSNVSSGYRHQSFKDGLLEVVGIFSSFHVAQLQMGLSSPVRLGQGKMVEVKLKRKAPVQIDGEPWEQNPSSIKITFANHCPVLINHPD
ncbi:diacylglycerol kinase epsilon [Coccinella septempunctata]|uniref:diacylglycerol kinase epsilon n=1 Tax=Coccinella septempunctata TaxID=41139 RepID=UPI001D084664|nr:diacylglycerol kinase epsilon [Coccinella septempunctata]